MASPAGSFHRSNLLTYGAVAAAVAAVAAARHGSAPAAGALVSVAVVLDVFDGRFARQFTRDGSQQRFGAELDSLADAISFGMAPAMCMALLMPPAPSRVLEAAWWAVVFLYAACAVTRLAFFNLHHADERFVGIPVPVAALVWASALLFGPGWLSSAAVFATTALAMVAPLAVPRPSGAGLALFAGWPLAVVAAHVSTLGT